MTVRTYSDRRHTGYVVSNDHGVVVATVAESRRLNGGYTVRLYTSPDDCAITRAHSILDARDIAERHALRMS